MLRSTSVFALTVTAAFASATAATPETRPRIVVAAQLRNFALLDTADARRRAEAAAIADAHARALGIAAATGARLGPLISVEDQAAPSGVEEITVTAMRANAPQVMAPPPIAIDIKPEPIETTATLVVTYAVGQ